MRHAVGSHRDIEAAQGEAGRVQGVTGRMQGEKEKTLVMGKSFTLLPFTTEGE